MGLHGDTPPPGYRQLTGVDLDDAALCARLVAEHQSRGGWGLARDPLKFGRASVLAAAEGNIRIQGCCIGMYGQDYNSTARGVYNAMNWTTNLPWSTMPPAPNAECWVGDLLPDPANPCLFVRVCALMFGAPSPHFNTLTDTCVTFVVLVFPSLFLLPVCFQMNQRMS